MTKDPIPLCVADAAGFARALAAEMEGQPAPSHLALLNMLARAAGFRNFQHLRAARAAGARLDAPPPPPPPDPADHRLVERALPLFDAAGRLAQWPARRKMQALCLWALWARLPRGTVLSERQVSEALTRWHLFGDAALLRRDMVGLGLLSRAPGATDYRRIEQPPPPEARALIARLAGRGAIGPAPARA